jgi:hypothetical protein
MGHENETVGDGYSKIKEDIAFRLEQAETVGLVRLCTSGQDRRCCPYCP